MTTFVHDRMKFFFIHVPKTGGMTVSHFFSRGNNRKWRDDFSLLNPQIGIHDGVEKIHLLLGEEMHGYFSFAFYRNTWEWFFSLYRYVRRTEKHPIHARVKTLTFEQFCFQEAEAFFRPQKPMVTLNGRQAVTRLVDFSTFPTVFPQILTSLGYRDVSVSASNQAETKTDHRTQYTPQMRDHVARVYADDISYFGFDF